MSNLKYFWISCFLYTFIDGFFNLFVPKFITQTLGYEYLWIYSCRFLFGLFVCLKLIKLLENYNLRSLLEICFSIVFLSVILLCIKEIYILLVLIPFIGFTDATFWSCSQAYLRKLHKNLSKTIPKWSLITVLGYSLSSILIFLLVNIPEEIFFAILIIIALFNMIIATFIPTDEIKEYHIYKINVFKALKCDIPILIVSFLMFSILCILFTALPVYLRFLNVNETIIAIAFMVLNIGRVIGNVISEKITLTFNTMRALIISKIFLIIVIMLIKNIYLFLAIVCIFGCFFAIYSNVWYIISSKLLPKSETEEELSVILTISGELSFVVVPLISGFITNYLIFLLLFITILFYGTIELKISRKI